MLATKHILSRKVQIRREGQEVRRAPDPSLVSCSGLGLDSPILGAANTVQVDCGQAGSSVLFAAILGPGGRQGQVRLKHMGKNTYRVDYHARDSGNHLLYVKWGEEHVPGSPFLLNVQ